MIELRTGTKIWLAAGVTDLRRGFDGLSAQVQTVLNEQPFSGHVFVFRGRRGDIVKVLWFDGDGPLTLSRWELRTLTKHEGFHEEREWRAIYAPTLGAYAPALGPSPLMESSTEVVSGVPQVVYKVPLDASVSDQIADLDFTQIFDHLIIGPTPYPWPIYSVFVDELTKAGVANSAERVRVSGIPIRA